MNTIIMPKTPHLDEISIEKWFKTVYNDGQLDEIWSLIEKEIWITATKTKIPVKDMTTKHIKNCINCWHGKGKLRIPSGYLGGKDKWLKIFNDELTRRN